jgi:hypothetical protein
MGSPFVMVIVAIALIVIAISPTLPKQKSQKDCTVELDQNSTPDNYEALQLGTFNFKSDCPKPAVINTAPATTGSINKCFTKIQMKDRQTGEIVNPVGTHPNVRFDFKGANLSVCAHASCSCQILVGDVIDGRFEVISSEILSSRQSDYSSAPLCTVHPGGYAVVAFGSTSGCKIQTGAPR